MRIQTDCTPEYQNIQVEPENCCKGRDMLVLLDPQWSTLNIVIDTGQCGVNPMFITKVYIREIFTQCIPQSCIHKTEVSTLLFFLLS